MSKRNFGGSFNDDDGFTLAVLTIITLLMLLMMVVFGPGYKSVAVSPQAVPTPTQSRTQFQTARPARPARLLPAQPKLLYMAEAPACLPPTPAITETPWPTPTPSGGGVLRKITFASNRADGRYYQLYMMDADGNNIERLTESRAFDRDPHFSYDGTCLAFSSNRVDNIYQIFVLDLQTRAARQLTFSRGDKTNPFWSPDNRQIIYTLHQGGYNEICIMNADGTQSRLLTSAKGDSRGYGFSPDGRFIAYEGERENRESIFLFNLATTESLLQVAGDPLSSRHNPMFSPKGHRLVFCSDALESKLSQLYVYDLDWKTYYRLTADNSKKDDPIFSPDGTKIAYTAIWENAWNIFVMDADGGKVRNLTRSYYDNVVPTWR